MRRGRETGHAALAALAALVVGCGGTGQPADTAAGATTAADTVPCTPLETRTANSPDQQPAFEGQTRACGIVTDTAAYSVEVVARGLEHPWAVEPLPGGDLLVTERPGRMRIVSVFGACCSIWLIFWS